MNYILLGISHKTAPLSVRERYAFSKKRVSEVLNKLSHNKMIGEAVILFTCNRTEVYATTNYSREAKEFLLNELRTTNYELRHFYFLQNNDVIKHLFRVSSGLDSQVIGETQILGQVKSAYFKAKELKTIKKCFNKLFQKAIEVGKIVRNNTKISEGNVSICSVALKLLENLCGTLKKKKILIIGTGKIGELITKYLIDKEISGTFVANRTYEKTIELAAKINGKAVRFDSLKDEIKNTDIIISATASPHLILKKEDIFEAINHKPLTMNNKLIIMDLALPRDVAPEIKNINNVILYNLDDLNLIIEENYEKRIQEAKKAEEIIEKEAEKFWQCLKHQSSIVNHQSLQLAPVQAP